MLCLIAQSCPTLCDPVNCSLSGSSVHGILQARILEWVAMPSSRGSSQPRDLTQVSHIASGFFTIWPTREAQDYSISSLSLLQGIFLTQELNQGLLHCRQFAYQLSYQGSPQDSMALVQKQRDQSNRMASPEINPPSYRYLSLKKEARIHNEERVSSISGTGKIGQLHVKEWN